VDKMMKLEDPYRLFEYLQLTFEEVGTITCSTHLLLFFRSCNKKKNDLALNPLSARPLSEKSICLWHCEKILSFLVWLSVTYFNRIQLSKKYTLPLVKIAKKTV